MKQKYNRPYTLANELVELPEKPVIIGFISVVFLYRQKKGAYRTKCGVGRFKGLSG